MKKQTRIGCFLGVGLGLFFLLVVGGWLFFRAVPSVENMVAEAPIIVDILSPSSGKEAIVGDFLTVDAKAFSTDASLASFELWADGKLFAQDADLTGNTADTSWVWQANKQGVHTLFVRAKDTQGRTGQSQVVIVNVLAGSGLVKVPAEEGQTLEEIGAQFDVPPDQLANSNPNIDPALPLQGGQPVQVPAGGGGAGAGPGQEGGQPPTGPTQEPKKPVKPLVFWIGQNLIPFLNSAALPQAPNVALTSDGCKFQVYITPQSNNASGFIVYRWKTGDTGFHNIATLGPGQQGTPILFEDTSKPVDLLAYMYYVSAFNALGEAKSIIVGQNGLLYGCQQAGSGDIIQVFWEFSSKEPVDQFYCYEASGDGPWKRTPADPFVFFDGQNGKYQQMGPFGNGEETQIQIQCWGWQGGVLKYLGEGGTKVDLLHPPDEVLVAGAGFQLAGQPQFQPKPDKFMGGGLPTIPAPFALREASTAAECASHYGNLLAGLVCDGLLNAQVKQYYTLVWEWGPKSCWPGTACPWVNDIDGYYLYEIDSSTNTQKYIKDIDKPGQKVTAAPLPWGYRCYGVKAYAEDPEFGGQIVSEMTTYCPGQPPEPEKIVLTPSDWLTTGGQWIQDGDCDTYGSLNAYTYYQNNGLLDGNSGQVLVGSYIVDDDDEDCFRQGDFSGGVKFNLPGLQSGTVFQKATLKFTEVFTKYKASGVATNYKLFCVAGVSKAKQDWTALGNDHFLGKNTLISYVYNAPLTSISGWNNSPQVDVTSVVSNWMKHPEQNHGFILTPANALSPAVDGSGFCESGVGNFQLEIFYFVPKGN